MQMLNSYSQLIESVVTRMYEQDEEYMYLDFEQALPRIKTIIMQMSMAEMQAYIEEETTDADFIRISKNNSINQPVCFGWLRLGNGNELSGANP